jgi:hypothetical protein
MRERAKKMTKSELQGNYWSQSNTVRELYRSQDKLYRSHREGNRSHREGNSSYTAYVMWGARGSTAERYSGGRLG